MNAAGRVGDIATPSRDQVDVTMEDRLPRGLADIDAYVETRDIRVSCEDGAPGFCEQGIDRPLLLGLEVEIAGSVDPRQDQGVERRHRRGIAHRVGERALCDDLLRGDRTEDASSEVGVNVGFGAGAGVGDRTLLGVADGLRITP